MKPDIRTKTYLVIEKDGKYLTGYGTFMGSVGWDEHLSNAWRTRNKAEAQEVAEKYGGTLELFNTVIWRTKKL